MQHGNGIHENRRDVQQIQMKPATENTHVSLWSRQKSISLTFIFAFNGQNTGKKKSSFALSTMHNQLVSIDDSNVSFPSLPPSNKIINQLTPPIITLQQVLVSWSDEGSVENKGGPTHNSNAYVLWIMHAWSHFGTAQKDRHTAARIDTTISFY